VAVLHGSSAFTAGVAPNASRSSASLGAAVQDVRVAGPAPQMPSAAQASGSALQLAGCAMLLVVSAGRALQAKKTQRSKCTVRCHVAASAFPASPAPAAAPLPHQASLAQPSTPTAAVPCLAIGAPVFAAKAEEAAFAGASAAATRRPRAARRVAGARQQSNRRSRSAMGATERASRRQTGAKLQAAVPVFTIPASFDPSRVRSKIQTGLRYKSSTRCASGREAQTPSASAVSSDKTRNYQLISGFAAIMNVFSISS